MQRQHTQSGFTLVESLVSVLILSFALIAVTTLLTRSLQATTIGQNYLVAAKLALEGQEMMRAKRNNNLLQRGVNLGETIAWNDNLIGTWRVTSLETDALQYGESFTFQNPDDDLPLLRIYTEGVNAGRYTYDTGDETKILSGNFVRIVSVDEINDYSVAVNTTVTWSGGSLTLSSVLYDAS